jgi:uncharacterized protein (DUF2141 family)
MLKRRISFIALPVALAVIPAVGFADILGPQPAMCAEGDGPAILVKASGFKNRAGTIRVRTFGGSPSTYFDKRHTLKRVEYAVPTSGPIEVCMPVPAPGVYAVDVRHDINSNSDTDRSDGAGASGNPKITLFDILFGRKPPAKQVQVSVGKGTTVVPIQVRYL